MFEYTHTRILCFASVTGSARRVMVYACYSSSSPTLIRMNKLRSWCVSPFHSISYNTDSHSHSPLRLQIDRHNDYRELQGFFFPHHERPEMPLRSSLLDGELVVDVDPKTKQVRTIHSPLRPILGKRLTFLSECLANVTISRVRLFSRR
jgi:hypothetical protein